MAPPGFVSSDGRVARPMSRLQCARPPLRALTGTLKILKEFTALADHACCKRRTNGRANFLRPVRYSRLLLLMPNSSIRQTKNFMACLRAAREFRIERLCTRRQIYAQHFGARRTQIFPPDAMTGACVQMNEPDGNDAARDCEPPAPLNMFTRLVVLAAVALGFGVAAQLLVGASHRRALPGQALNTP